MHDAFTISEISHCEALGLCVRGFCGPLTASGATTLGGRIPVKTSGGLQARGHRPGARQIDGAQVARLLFERH